SGAGVEVIRVAVDDEAGKAAVVGLRLNFLVSCCGLKCLTNQVGKNFLVRPDISRLEPDSIALPAGVVVHQVQACFLDALSGLRRALQSGLNSKGAFLWSKNHEVVRRAALGKADIEFVVLELQRR